MNESKPIKCGARFEENIGQHPNLIMSALKITLKKNTCSCNRNEKKKKIIYAKN